MEQVASDSEAPSDTDSDGGISPHEFDDVVEEEVVEESEAQAGTLPEGTVLLDLDEEEPVQPEQPDAGQYEVVGTINLNENTREWVS